MFFHLRFRVVHTYSRSKVSVYNSVLAKRIKYKTIYFKGIACKILYHVLYTWNITQGPNKNSCQLAQMLQSSSCTFMLSHCTSTINGCHLTVLFKQTRKENAERKGNSILLFFLPITNPLSTPNSFLLPSTLTYTTHLSQNFTSATLTWTLFYLSC